MSESYRAEDWDSYRMDYREPYRELEPPAREAEVVDEVLRELVDAEILPHADYDQEKLTAHRRAVRELFEVPWTAITPRMERLIYAVNAVSRPANMIAAGIFCGFTFICNAGAAVGPGACYTAENLVGVEIREEEADRAERNVRRIDPTGVARIVADDAVSFVAEFGEPIDLLYLDADGAGGRGKAIYLDILEAAWERIPPDGIVLAHNSVNSAEKLEDYLAFVRDSGALRASLNAVIDPEGLEVSVK